MNTDNKSYERTGFVGVFAMLVAYVAAIALCFLAGRYLGVCN